MAQWYILYNGQQIGPMEQEQLLAYGLNPDSQVWTEGMPQWAAAYTLPDLMTMINDKRGGTPSAGYSTPGGVPPMAQDSMLTDSGKSKVAAGVLALLLGYLGVHYFYCGKVGGGLITILLVCVTCGLWNILVFVQGILMLTMSQAEFDRKYVYSKSAFPLF